MNGGEGGGVKTQTDTKTWHDEDAHSSQQPRPIHLDRDFWELWPALQEMI